MLRRPHNGFSLIEMALILVIFGAVAAVIFKPLTSLMRGEKRLDSTAAVMAAKDGVIGFAMISNTLPATLDQVASPLDARGQTLHYLPSPDLQAVDICTVYYTSVDFTVQDDGSTIDHVAFVVASPGEDMQDDVDYTARPLILDDPNGVRDDIVEYVTVLELMGAACAN